MVSKDSEIKVSKVENSKVKNSKKVSPERELTNWEMDCDENIPDGIIPMADNVVPSELIPKQFKLSKTAKGYYNALAVHLDALGIDTHRYALTILLLAKHYATEQQCEEAIEENKGLFYTTGKESTSNLLYKKHPAVEVQHTTRILILNTLKALGLMHDGKGGLTVSINGGANGGGGREPGFEIFSRL